MVCESFVRDLNLILNLKSVKRWTKKNYTKKKMMKIGKNAEIILNKKKGFFLVAVMYI